MNQPIKIQPSNGNIFADLALDNAEELLVKAELARKICNIIAAQNMTENEAANLLDIEKSQVSALVNGKLSSFSTNQLFRFLNALGRDVEIVIKPKSSQQAQTRVVT